MFYSHSHDDAPHRGWADSYLAFEAVMAASVALIVALMAAILFMPLWVG